MADTKQHSPFRTMLIVPIYNVKVYISVCTDIAAERMSLDDKWGKPKADALRDMSEAYGLCSTSNDGRFALIFKRDGLNLNTVAHEVFHLTIGIFSLIHQPWNNDSDETAALLHAFLLDETLKALCEKKTKILIPGKNNG